MDRTLLQDLPPTEPLLRASLQPTLRPGETVLSVGMVSPGIYWKGVAMLIVALLAAFEGVYLALYFGVIALGLLALAYGWRTYLLLAATNRRVLLRYGIFNTDVIQLHYSQIESLEVFRPLMGGFLGYANVVITGTGNRRIVIPFIENAGVFEDILDQKITERDDRLEGVRTA